MFYKGKMAKICIYIYSNGKRNKKVYKAKILVLLDFKPFIAIFVYLYIQ